MGGLLPNLQENTFFYRKGNKSHELGTDSFMKFQCQSRQGRHFQTDNRECNLHEINTDNEVIVVN
jgi:hypothetical protein